jgi:hypothetical protein
MTVTLESLELGAEELEACRDTVHKMAYFNWLDAGCPHDRQLEFWLKAERDWIERCYVPTRTLDGSRPQTVRSAAAAAGRKRSLVPSAAIGGRGRAASDSGSRRPR